MAHPIFLSLSVYIYSLSRFVISPLSTRSFQPFFILRLSLASHLFPPTIHSPFLVPHSNCLADIKLVEASGSEEGNVSNGCVC